jgi:hypothetical protein
VGDANDAPPDGFDAGKLPGNLAGHFVVIRTDGKTYEAYLAERFGKEWVEVVEKPVVESEPVVEKPVETVVVPSVVADETATEKGTAEMGVSEASHASVRRVRNSQA